MALLRFAGTVGFWTLASRILGFIRDILIARFLGTTGVVEAFFVAFRFPNLFRRLVAEGAFTAAFVPMFSKKLERDGQPTALKFADETLALLVTVLLVFTVLCEIFMPWIMRAIAPGFVGRTEIFAATVLFARIMMPYLICMALLALYSGVLNSIYRFGAAAAAPILLNVVLIAGMLLARRYFETPAHLLSWGVAAAGVGQFVWLALSAHRAGVSIRFPVPRLSPDTKRLLAIMVPGAIGAGVMQINLLVGTVIASLLPKGAVSYLYYADRVYQLPLGLIGIAIGTALLPDLSRRLAREGEEAMALFNRAIELSMFLTLPAAVALMVVPQPIVAVLFERGRFDAVSASATTWTLAAFATGLPAYVLNRVLTPGYFARHDTRTPLYYGMAGVAANIALSLILIWPLSYVGIAVATSLSAWINVGLLAWTLRRRGHLALDAGIKRRLPRSLLASIVMGAALVGIFLAIDPWFAGRLPLKVAGLALLVVGGMAVYFGGAFALRAVGLAEIRSLARRQAPAEAAPGPAPPETGDA
jgi:putative peptidoglycan lipid II flippase